MHDQLSAGATICTLQCNLPLFLLYITAVYLYTSKLFSCNAKEHNCNQQQYLPKYFPIGKTPSLDLGSISGMPYSTVKVN
jgi:hypothetical protein